MLAPPFEAPQAVQKGIADVAYFFPAFMVNQDPANAFLAGLPGGMSAEATMAWLFYGGGEKLWVRFSARDNEAASGNFRNWADRDLCACA